jgi:chaperonin GroEL (HSP60 family)
LLAKKGIFALQRVKRADLEKIAKATGAKIVNNDTEATVNDLGKAGLVEQRNLSGDEATFIEQCTNPKSVTILLRGGTEHVIDEIERAVVDAIGDISSVIRTKGLILAGGGGAEMEISKELIKYSNTMNSREQFAIRAYAQAMEVIPRTLANNAGIDSLDVLTSLKKRHDEEDGKDYGIDVFTGLVSNMINNNVLEPLVLKTQALTGATEAAIMILRIDDVIAMNPAQGEQPQ